MQQEQELSEWNSQLFLRQCFLKLYHFNLINFEHFTKNKGLNFGINISRSYQNSPIWIFFQITELKASNFTTENELRKKLKTLQKEHEDKVDSLNNRISSLLKEVASLSKTAKKGKGVSATSASGDNNSSGTDSPSIQ